MEKNKIIQLTNNLYQLTLLFPKKEPLRHKMREAANEILADLALIIKDCSQNPKDLVLEAEKNLETLDNFFEVARSQNWVRPLDLLNNSKGKEVLVHLKGDKQFAGTLLAFDIHINLVLDNIKEIQNNEIKRNLGLTFLRGDTIIFISPASTALKKE